MVNAIVIKREREREIPIFEKDGRRIMFAHIPKCGGISIYSSFVGAGWTMKNLRVSSHPESAFSTLQRRFGINSIEQHGRLFGYPHPPQHVPKLIWMTWGPFEASFSIVRDPIARLLSTLRYHHRMTGDSRPFEDFSKEKLRQASKRPWSHYRVLNGHLIPQHYFVGRDTEVFRFEEGWGNQIARRFDVDPPPHDNKAPESQDTLSIEWHHTARRIFRKDFARFYY